jgi:hypothetical protein
METNHDIPPKVKWYSRADRERTPSHALVKARYQRLINDVWKRLPPSARIAIVGHPMWEAHDGIYLANHDPEGKGICAGKHGVQHTGEVVINVCLYCDLRKHDRRITMTWVVTHELAHVFYSAMNEWVQWGFMALLERKKLKDKKKYSFTDGESSLMAALNLSNGTRSASMIDHDKTSYTALTNERLADALAIAWGFGFEYAHQIAKHGLCSEDVESMGESYLDSEILKIHEVLAELENNPV